MARLPVGAGMPGHYLSDEVSGGSAGCPAFGRRRPSRPPVFGSGGVSGLVSRGFYESGLLGQARPREQTLTPATTTLEDRAAVVGRQALRRLGEIGGLFLPAPRSALFPRARFG